MEVKKNNMSKEELLSALSFTDTSKAHGIVDSNEDRANYNSAHNSLTDIKHLTAEDYQEALTYFEKFAPGNVDMNKVAYHAIQICLDKGWT